MVVVPPSSPGAIPTRGEYEPSSSSHATHATSPACPAVAGVGVHAPPPLFHDDDGAISSAG